MSRRTTAAQHARTRARPTCEPLEQRVLLSLTIDLDYSFDTQGFFDDPDRREVVEFAAEYLGGLIDDSLLAIIPGSGNSWSARFNHPGTGELTEVDNPVIPEDTIRIYVGGRDLGASQLGLGGAGGWSATGSTSFLRLVEGRGQSGAIGPESSRTDFATWGGSVAFDIDANWHVSLSTTGLSSGANDLLSLALHEFAHVLGFADSTPSFENLISSLGTFTGGQSLAVWEAPEFAFDGDTTGAARWQRPQTLTTLSATATDTPYQAITTTVGRTGNYHILSDQGGPAGWDGVLLVYQNAFDPADPLANLIAINDDYGGGALGAGGTGVSGIDNLNLVAGRRYIIVTTGFSDTEAGAYRLEVQRPASTLRLDPGDQSHWRSGIFSGGQEALLDPSLTTGTRKLLTPLDWAGLADIGWEIAGPRWPGVGASVTLDMATGGGAAIRAASENHPGLHRFTPQTGGFVEVVADASAPVTLRLWDSAGRLVAVSEASSPGASVIAHAANETYTLEVVSAESATYELRFATTPAGHTLYFPEGFITWQTTETVWLSNSGPEPVSYTLRMHYEDAALPRAHDTLASGAVLAPGEQVQIQVSSGGSYPVDVITGEAVFIYTPYALVLQATGHVAATVQRSDVFEGERISTAEAFTSEISRTWTFARADKSGGINDFLVYYNPHDHDALVTITFFTGGVERQIEQVVGAGRRGGLNLSRETMAPEGVSGVIITSVPVDSAHESDHRGIVAALSHFDGGAGDGWLALGHPGELAAAGVLAAAAPGSDSELLLFNPGPAAAEVEIRDGASMVAMVSLAPRQVRALPAPAAIGLTYRVTSGAAAVQLVERLAGEAASSAPAQVAARNHFFGAAELPASIVGGTSEAALLVFNPGSAPAEVQVRLRLSGGGEAVRLLSVGAGGFARLLLSDVPEIAAGGSALSIFVRSTAPVLAMLSVFGGEAGWAAPGAPAGVLDPLA